MNPIKKILSYVPEPLPVGMTEFNKFADEIIDLAGNYADKDSMTWAIASQIIHSSKSSISKHQFVCQLRKAAANQIASQVFQDIKIKQAEVAKLAQEAKLAEVPAIEASDVKVLPDQKV